MSLLERTPLEEAFIKDHRRMIQGLSTIIESLEKGDIETAVREADQVDRSVGPHIRFEEEVLYDETAKVRGREYASRLYGEHASMREGLKRLLDPDRGGNIDPASRRDIVDRLKVGLEHAYSCGALVSHLTALDPGRQQEMLDRLIRLRTEGVRWTRLPPPPG